MAVVYVCSSCSRSRPVPARDLRDLDAETIRGLRLFVRKRRPKPTARKRAYLAALKSPHWRKLRERIRERSAGACEVPGCDGEFQELAHLTYERLGSELDGDVQAQCRAHNQNERERRIARSVLGGPG